MWRELPWVPTELLISLVLSLRQAMGSGSSMTLQPALASWLQIWLQAQVEFFPLSVPTPVPAVKTFYNEFGLR